MASRQKLNEILKAMRPGMKVELTWNFDAPVDVEEVVGLPAAEEDQIFTIEDEAQEPPPHIVWRDGVVQTVDGIRALIRWPAGNERLETGPDGWATVPFPPQPADGWFVVVHSVRLKRPTELPTIKGIHTQEPILAEARHPAPAQNTQPIQREEAMDLADALRGEDRKTTLCLGLKIPMLTTREFAPFYLATYVTRIQQESAESVANEWVADFDDTVRRIGAESALTHEVKRRILFQKRDATGQWIKQHTGRMPMDKDGFTDMFDRAFDLFSIVAFGLWGGQFEDFAKQALLDAWQSDFVDFKKVFQELQKKHKAQHKPGTALGRSRGRGGARGGRGAQTGRNQQVNQPPAPAVLGRGRGGSA